jgi:hypothetical protein
MGLPSEALAVVELSEGKKNLTPLFLSEASTVKQVPSTAGLSHHSKVPGNATPTPTFAHHLNHNHISTTTLLFVSVSVSVSVSAHPPAGPQGHRHKRHKSDSEDTEPTPDFHTSELEQPWLAPALSKQLDVVPKGKTKRNGRRIGKGNELGIRLVAISR